MKQLNKSSVTQFLLAAFLAISTLFISGCNNGSNSSNQASPKLIFLTQPSSNSTPTGTQNPISPAIQVEVLNSSGSLDTSANIPISLSIESQPNNGIYTAMLSGTTTVNTINGIATFTDISLTEPGNGYILAASSTNIQSALSSSFNVTSSISIAETAGFEPTGNHTGYEIAYVGGLGSNYTGYVYVYIDYGNNPITTQNEFDNFSCPGWIKNTPRNAFFDYSLTLGSPLSADGPLVEYTDCQNHTWGYIVQNQSYNWPFNATDYPAPEPQSGWEAGQVGSYVPPGVVTYSSINKNQSYLYTARDINNKPILRFFITDQWGNVYIMKSSNAANTTPEQINASFESAVLPYGWTKSTAYLKQDLYINPAYNNFGESSYPGALFTDFRDNSNNAYAMVYWGPSGNSIAQQIGKPMPIAIFPLGGRLNGTPLDDLIYGSFGDDQIYPFTGNDIIDGGAGKNGVFFQGNSNLFNISTSGVTTTVIGAGGMKTLTNIQYLQFDDIKIEIAK